MEGRESEVKWKRKKIEINNRQGKTILIVPFRDRLSVIGEGEILARAEVDCARFYFFNCIELFLHECLGFFKNNLLSTIPFACEWRVCSGPR